MEWRQWGTVKKLLTYDNNCNIITNISQKHLRRREGYGASCEGEENMWDAV